MMEGFEKDLGDTCLRDMFDLNNECLHNSYLQTHAYMLIYSLVIMHRPNW